ncbi:hypothetical protein VB715_04170 [Crocosphaera sp. UHCC 0190]|uniref:hypothetical protein n=1 Tax=Crocosphaera sp. UHCC 0190 TaxID=3110246 RepID=UPI002B21E6D2|nr:hypothetical protein [Crocosphaera sp. UHCC 0190]MEA5508952.1 hypothetical protein [Crocosphaera sp. UHCC 0190]
MFKYFLPMTALVVSVTGVGISLAREEIRCYLGLSSAACHTSEVKSVSPSPLKPLFNHKPIQETIAPNNHQESQVNLENSETKTSSEVNSSEPEKQDVTTTQDMNTASSEDKMSESKFIPVEELSAVKERQPPVNYDNSSSASPEETVGIPIEVEPYQESSNSQPQN